MASDPGATPGSTLGSAAERAGAPTGAALADAGSGPETESDADSDADTDTDADADADSAAAAEAPEGRFGLRMMRGLTRPVGAQTRPKAAVKRASKPPVGMPRHEAKSPVRAGAATGGSHGGGGRSTLRPGGPALPSTATNTPTGTPPDTDSATGPNSEPRSGKAAGPGRRNPAAPGPEAATRTNTTDPGSAATTGPGAGTATGPDSERASGPGSEAAARTKTTSPGSAAATGPGSTGTTGPASGAATGPDSQRATAPGSETTTRTKTTSPGSAAATGPGSTGTTGPDSGAATGPDSERATGPGSGGGSDPGSSPAPAAGKTSARASGPDSTSGSVLDSPPDSASGSVPDSGPDSALDSPPGSASGSGHRSVPDPGHRSAPDPASVGKDTPPAAPGEGAAKAGPPAAAAGADPAEAPEAPEATPTSAFDALYGRTAPALARQAYLLTGRHALACEAVERAFQLAWDRWPEVATDPDPVGWVRAATYEYALSPWHRFRRSHRHPDEPPADPADRVLLDAMLELPPAHRRTVLLYDGVGLDLPDTAAETEASTPTAGSRLVNAHADLADVLPELDGVAPAKQSAVLRERLGTLRPPGRLEPRAAAVVRLSGEHRTRLWTRAVVGVSAVIAAATAYTWVTAPTEYEPPRAPGASVSGVPPHSGPQQLTDEGRQLHDKLLSDPSAGPSRISPSLE
ncbi:hypothetical protein [Streptomyces sp. NBC_01298]|uniref:hypothetical protein n=1 Tax=Streptomyces sp. NBC_01298 TaxID=2903817 RepID=UPI002E112767